MTPRPPTLRENRRYILARVLPAGSAIDQKELYFAISDATTSLWGDAAAAVITPAVVAAEGDYVFIRCRRGTERELAIALSTVTGCRDARIALRILAISGTMESLRERIRGMKAGTTGTVAEGETPARTPGLDTAPDTSSTAEPAAAVCPSQPECRFGSATCIQTWCDGHKVDVIEKGFKNTHRFFLTREDLEKG